MEKKMRAAVYLGPEIIELRDRFDSRTGDG